MWVGARMGALAPPGARPLARLAGICSGCPLRNTRARAPPSLSTDTLSRRAKHFMAPQARTYIQLSGHCTFGLAMGLAWPQRASASAICQPVSTPVAFSLRFRRQESGEGSVRGKSKPQQEQKAEDAAPASSEAESLPFAVLARTAFLLAIVFAEARRRRYGEAALGLLSPIRVERRARSFRAEDTRAMRRTPD